MSATFPHGLSVCSPAFLRRVDNRETWMLSTSAAAATSLGCVKGWREATSTMVTFCFAGRPGRTTRSGPLGHPVHTLLESTQPSCDGDVVLTCLFLYLIYDVTTFTTGRIFRCPSSRCAVSFCFVLTSLLSPADPPPPAAPVALRRASVAWLDADVPISLWYLKWCNIDRCI